MINFIKEFISLHGGVAGVCSADKLDGEYYAGFTPFVKSDAGLRANPSLILPGAKSIITVCLPHSVPEPQEGGAVLSSLGSFDDYHKKLKNILHQLAAELKNKISFSYKVLADSATLDERAFAVRSGICFFGRNGMVIVPGLGSFVNVGLILTDIPMEFVSGEFVSDVNAVHSDDTANKIQTFPEDASKLLSETAKHSEEMMPSEIIVSPDKKMQCPPDCRRCIDACPGGALGAGNALRVGGALRAGNALRVGDALGAGNALRIGNALCAAEPLDFARCASYITQKDGELTDEEKQIMGRNLYGCDICRDVCPFNKKTPRVKTRRADPNDWLSLSDEELAESIQHTAMAWKGTKILKRNAEIVANQLTSLCT